MNWRQRRSQAVDDFPGTSASESGCPSPASVAWREPGHFGSKEVKEYERSVWRFPEMYPQSIHLNGIFQYKPSIWGTPISGKSVSPEPHLHRLQTHPVMQQRSYHGTWEHVPSSCKSHIGIHIRQIQETIPATSKMWWENGDVELPPPFFPTGFKHHSAPMDSPPTQTTSTCRLDSKASSPRGQGFTHGARGNHIPHLFTDACPTEALKRELVSRCFKVRPSHGILVQMGIKAYKAIPPSLVYKPIHSHWPLGWIPPCSQRLSTLSATFHRANGGRPHRRIQLRNLPGK